MDLNNFNFANPNWLWGLLLIPAVYIWQRFIVRRQSTNELRNFVDPKLLPHIVVNHGMPTKNTKRNWLYAATFACVILALANPRWNFTEVEAYKPNASTVVMFDLSDPANVAAGRQQITDFIQNSRGIKIGLIAFASIPHMVTPITDDLATVKNFLPALDSDLISKPGDNLAAALTMAQELLAHEPGNNKSLLLVSSGVFTNQAYTTQLKKIQQENIDVYVLGVGDQNQAALRAIADQTHGYYAVADHAERSINTILHKIQHKQDNQQVVAGKIRQWEDRYYLLLIPAALMFVYLWRIGALLLIVLCIHTPSVYAAELFSNSDQQAAKAFKQNDYDRAAELFKNAYNKGVALYRAGKYAEAEESFKRDNSIAALYNAGNSQMQQQKWQAAIKSYELVLASNPDHLDAKHNLEIARSNVVESAPQVNQEETQQQQEFDSRNQTDSERGNNFNEEATMEQLPPPPVDPGTQSEAQEEKNINNQMEQEKQRELQEMDTTGAGGPGTEQGAKESEGTELWLNRIDSDIKVLLRNKFYIEDKLSEQDS